MKTRPLLLYSNSVGSLVWANNLYSCLRRIFVKMICAVKLILYLSCLCCVFFISFTLQYTQCFLVLSCSNKQNSTNSKSCLLLFQQSFKYDVNASANSVKFAELCSSHLNLFEFLRRFMLFMLCPNFIGNWVVNIQKHKHLIFCCNLYVGYSLIAAHINNSCLQPGYTRWPLVPISV